MKFDEFKAAREAAKAALEQFDGDDNMPGLGKFDRVYALPEDCYGWPCTAIVRVNEINKHRVPILVHTWRRHAEELKCDDMTAGQHEAIAHIKRTATEWIRGAIPKLPPSTSLHWRRDDEI